MSEKVWDYRIVRSNKEDGTSADWYSIQEIYYDDETGEPTAQSIDLQVEGEDNTELRKQLVDMVTALDKDVIDEIKSEVKPPNSQIFESPDNGNTVYSRNFGETERTLVTDNPKKEIDINQRLSNLEIENTDLKNMLREKGVDIV